ncbi:hypothetical protein RRG08_040802 [Elysia crispata]|uniref:SMB domain-containing protein n=1 Tax=Elysia crispata TaxID=231223 RepID=A0AAE1BEB9_9GAST|nr:hypothetical protein RRG08_040802 [Elysia crispata]
MLVVCTQFLFITIAVQEFQWSHQTRAQVATKETQPHLSVTTDSDSTAGDGSSHLATSGDFQFARGELWDRLAGALEISTMLDPGNQLPLSPLPPWYLNYLAGLNESFSLSNRTYSEFLEFERMLRESQDIIDPYRYSYEEGAIEVSNAAYKMVSGPEMTAAIYELDMCSQPDVLKRISCRDRCGQRPESSELPAQCGCDQDCFMHGDCCEDMNKFCTDMFVLAITKFYENRENFFVPQCYKYEPYVLLQIYQSERLNSSVEPRVFEIDCHSEIHKDDALQNIFNAMRKADCTFKSIVMDKLISSRLCDRPDILACGSEKSPDEFTFYPIHLLCFGHANTLRLFTRYRNGPDGMEIIGQRGNCSLLRHSARGNADILTSAKRNGPDGMEIIGQRGNCSLLRHSARGNADILTSAKRNGPDGMEIIGQRGNCSHLRHSARGNADILTSAKSKNKQWQKSHMKKLTLTVVTKNGQTFFNFETAKWRRLRSTGGLEISDWGCEVIECSDNQFFDEKFQTCYSPDYAYIQITESRTDAPKDSSSVARCRKNNAASNSTRQNPGHKAVPNVNIQLCPCLKAQTVLRAVSLWLVLADTSALLDGRCGFNLTASSPDQLIFTRSDGGGNVSRNWNVTTSTGASTIEDTTKATAQKNIAGVNFLSHRLPSLWSKRRNECTETEYPNLEICFVSTVRSDLETTCFTVQHTSPEIRDSCFFRMNNMGLRYFSRYDYLFSLLIVNALSLVVKRIG